MLLPPMFSMHVVAAAGLLLCVLSLLIAYFFMERFLLLEPCPLCILDRIAVGGMALGFLVLGWGRRRWTAWLAWAGTTLMLAAGWVFAARHIWLQNRPPDEAASCLADGAAAEEFIALVRQAFSAEADCGAIMWEFAGFTIPEQVLLLFAVLTVMQIWLAWALIQRGRRGARGQEQEQAGA